MIFKVNQAGVEWYNSKTNEFYNCQVLKHYKSKDTYKIKVGGVYGIMRVPAEQLGIHWSILEAQRKAEALPEKMPTIVR